ncbi:MAG: HAMP domain-containing sensor histidine kinase [Anaerolineae bacterium]
MSIRLRLTLLYSAILFVTLIVLGAFLYFTQAQLTMDGIRDNLVQQAEDYAGRVRRFPRRTDPATGLVVLPGRWMQTRNLDGTVAGRTGDLADITLPLSQVGLNAVQNGNAWTEKAQVQGEPLLLYSRPITVENNLPQILQVAAPISERDQALGTLRWILTAVSLLAILAAFGIGWVLAGLALSPIHQITHTAQVIGAERDFSRRVEYRGPTDEVGQLATTFNSMLTELEQAYRQLEETLQTQQRFVADASHELRTPLTTIRGNLEFLQHESPVDAADRADALTDTKEEVDRLIRLVNQLLTLARVDAGRPLQPEPLPVKALVEDVCRQIKPRAPRRSITYQVPEETAVMADRDAIKQVLLNLLDNGIKHTPSTAAVEITSTEADGYVTIRVRDTGPGISPQILPHIFERFYRGQLSRSGPGTGLGLAIARELVQAQNGTLAVESQVGQGSVFTITLPRASG